MTRSRASGSRKLQFQGRMSQPPAPQRLVDRPRIDSQLVPKLSYTGQHGAEEACRVAGGADRRAEVDERVAVAVWVHA